MSPLKRSKKSAAPPPTMNARKQAFVRQAIWEAALNLFVAKGFDETTVDDIAAAAGVSQRSFFRYFPSKTELVANTVTTYADAVIETIDACPRDLSAPAVLRRAVLHVVEQAAGYPGTRKIVAVTAKSRAAQAAQMSRVPEAQARIAEAYARRLKFRKGDPSPKMLAALTTLMVDTVLQSALESGDSDIAGASERAFATLSTLIA